MPDSTLQDEKQQHDLLTYLKSQQQLKSDLDLFVSNNNRKGTINIRGGIAVAAETGCLQGNGAIMSLVAFPAPQITPTTGSDAVQKSVFVSLAQIEQLLNVKSPSAPKTADCNEDALLAEAKNLFFQFRLKQAGEKLIEILRANRFYYPAWLWKSRIINRQDYIERAIDEAHKWGNHDQDIWREARKIRPQLDGTATKIKRCFFCWSPLKEKAGLCSYCNAVLHVGQPKNKLPLRAEEVKFAISMYERAFRQDSQNSRVAYSLAVGYFNLQNYKRALYYMGAAIRIAPRVELYSKSLAILNAVAKKIATKHISQPSPAQTTTTEPPAVAAAPAAPHPKPSTVSPVTTSPSQNSAGTKKTGKSIMVIEDSPTSRKVLSMILGRKGYTIFEAASGKEALSLATEIRPNLVLLDVMLPDMTGYDILPKLKKIHHFKNLPVVMLTGKKGPTDRLKGIQAGTNEYLTKPFNPEKLLSVIGGYI